MRNIAPGITTSALYPYTGVVCILLSCVHITSKLIPYKVIAINLYPRLAPANTLHLWISGLIGKLLTLLERQHLLLMVMLQQWPPGWHRAFRWSLPLMLTLLSRAISKYNQLNFFLIHYYIRLWKIIDQDQDCMRRPLAANLPQLLITQLS